MAYFKNYSPSLVTMSFRDINVVGIAESTFVEVERNEDGFSTQAGANGDVTRTRNLNRTGKVTITLQQASPTNDLLTSAYRLDELTGSGYGAIQIKDLSGTAVCEATHAWILKLPKMERAKESGSVIWVFECADLKLYVGGNLI